MSQLWLLFKDELNGFYKSNVMIAMWIGLPLIGLLMYYTTTATAGPHGVEIPFTVFAAMVISSLGGTLGSILLTVNIIDEKDKHVYDLFVVRPIQRQHILIAKFAAVFLCLVAASTISLGLGIVIDAIQGNASMAIIEMTVESIITSMSVMAISAAAGIFIGIVSPSALVGVILIIFGSSQIAPIPAMLPMLGIPNAPLYAVISGVVLTAVLLFISVFMFDRKEF
jgi:ABC-2 type transport system permease protein